MKHLVVAAMVASACSGSQKATEVRAAKCGVAEVNDVIKILDDKTTNGAAKLLALAVEEQEVTACLKASKPPVVDAGVK